MESIEDKSRFPFFPQSLEIARAAISPIPTAQLLRVTRKTYTDISIGPATLSLLMSTNIQRGAHIDMVLAHIW